MGAVTVLAVAIVAAVVGVALAREWWCHRYYPSAANLFQAQRRVDLAANVWERYLATRTLGGGRVKLLARIGLCHCYYRLGRWQDAAEQCDAVARAMPLSPLARLVERVKRDALARAGGNPLAEGEAIEAIAESGPAVLYAATLEVDRLENDGRWQEAMALLESLVEPGLTSDGAPPLPQLRLRLGQLQLRLGYYEEALAVADVLLSRPGLSTELQHDSRSLSARAALALERTPQDRVDAEAAYRIAALAQDREKLIDDALLLGLIASHHGEFVEAMRWFLRAREHGGRGRWLASAAEGELLALWGRDAEAERSFEQAARVAADPALGGQSGPAVVALAYAAALADDDPTRALQVLEPHLGESLPNLRLAGRRDVLAAVLLTAAGRTEEAAAYREAMAAVRARSAHDRHELATLDLAEAEIARAEGRWQDAVAHYRAALARPPYRVHRPRIEVRLARALEELGETEEAERAWRRAAEFEFPLGAVLLARRRLAER